MITKEEAYAWMDRQVEACNMTLEPLGDTENLTFWPDKEIHVSHFPELVDALERPYIRSHHTDTTDKLHFTYKGVEFFGLSWDKRIGKKVAE